MRYFVILTLAMAMFSLGCEKKAPVVDSSSNAPPLTQPPPDTLPPVVTPTPTPAPTPPPLPPVGARTYTVMPKDTLYSIAKTQLGDGKRYKEIMELNAITDATKLQVGQVLKLPAK